MKTKITFLLSVVMLMCLGTQAQTLLGTTCADAISIQCDGTLYTGSTTGFTNDNATSSAGQCITSIGTGGQIWYSWTATSSSMVDFSTCYATTSFDTKIHVYAGACGALTCVAGNDDGCSSLKSLVSFLATDGVTYLIRVGGFGAAAGNFTFSATCYDQGDYGCMDSLATNFDPLATINDGSCYYPIYGCMDSTAINYAQGANMDDGSCIYCNNPGSLAATLYLCTFSNASQVSLDIFDSNGEVVVSLNGGDLSSISYHDICLSAGTCYTAVMSNSAGLNGWYNGYFWINGTGGQYINTSLDDNMSTQTVIFSIDGTCATILGCTDEAAANYNPDANTEDGTCVYPVSCEDMTAITATMTTGSFANETWFEILDADGNVVYLGDGYTSNQFTYTQTSCLADGCYTIVMHDTFGDGWNGAVLVLMANGAVTSYTLPSGDFGYGVFSINSQECEPSIPVGCTNPLAVNYSETAVYDDGSCIIEGCLDQSATNYNPSATQDNGSCEYCNGDGSVLAQLYVCTFSNGAQVELQIVDDAGNEVAYISGLNNGQIFYSTVCLQAGMCYTANMINNEGPFGWSNGYFWINGTGGQYINAEPGATDEFASQIFSIDGTCGAVTIYGCTDPNANNYNQDATVEDGSCDYSIDCDLNTVSVVISSEAWGTEMSWNITNEAGEVVYAGNGVGSWSWAEESICLADGCYQFNMNDSWGDGWNGGYYMVSVNGLYFEGSLLYGFEASDLISINGNCSEIGGCMDSTAMNYNAQATFDDGSCMYNNNDGFLATGLIGLEMGVNLYPNPANSGLVVNLTNLDRTAEIVVSIVGIDGRLITRQQFANADRSQKVEMNVEALAAGLYLVQVSNGDSKATMTLVKE